MKRQTTKIVKRKVSRGDQPNDTKQLTISEEKNLCKNTRKSIIDTAKWLFTLGMAVITFNIVEVSLGNGKFKKEFHNLPKPIAPITKTNCMRYVNPRCTGLGILTGLKSNVLILEIDDKEDKERGIFNGLKMWNRLIKKHSDPYTPKAQSGNGGYHYYFQLTEKTIMFKNFSGVKIKGRRYSIDFRNKAGMIVVAPSKYKALDGSIKSYKWINSLEDTEIIEMPDWLFDLLNNEYNMDREKPTIDLANYQKVYDQKNNGITPYMETILEKKTITQKKLQTVFEDGIRLISKDRNWNYDQWLNVGILCFQFGVFGINKWVEFSKHYDHFDINEILYKVNTFYHSPDGLKFGSLIKWINEDQQKGYTEYLIKYKKELNVILKTDDELRALYIDKKCKKVDIGYVDLYHEEFKDDLVCVDQDTQSYYLYNCKNRLWEPKSTKDILKHFLANIKKITRPLVKYYEDIANTYREKGNIDKAKQYDKLANDTKYTPEFVKASKAKQLLPLITSDFYDKDFAVKLNNNPIYIPVKGGVIDLKKGTFEERTKNHYFTFEMDVDWLGLDTKTPTIDKFMNDIMLDNKELIMYLQKLLGYSISGFVNQQRFVIFFGSGGNGKGVLMNMMKELMKTYYRQCTSDVVIQGKKTTAGGASPHIMELLGARLAVVDESDMGSKLNESVVKNITGGGAITARPLFKNMVTFEPTFQLILLTNHKPEINVNQSIERRLVLIPFLADFKSKAEFDKNNKRHRLKDDNIENVLKDKLDELLVWLVNGSVRYFQEGLGQMPELAKKATKEYLDENDDIGNLIDEHCEKDVNGFVYHKELYELYISTYTKISQMSFTNMMKQKGYQVKRRRTGRGFSGLKLKNNNEFDDLDE